MLESKALYSEHTILTFVYLATAKFARKMATPFIWTIVNPWTHPIRRCWAGKRNCHLSRINGRSVYATERRVRLHMIIIIIPTQKIVSKTFPLIFFFFFIKYFLLWIITYLTKMSMAFFFFNIIGKITLINQHRTVPTQCFLRLLPWAPQESLWEQKYWIPGPLIPSVEGDSVGQ